MNPVTVTGLAVAGLSAAALAALASYTVTHYPPNDLTPEAAKNLAYCKGWIDKVVASLGGTLTSAYRSPRVNALVGGSPTSDHMRGLAADVTPGKHLSVQAAFELARDLSGRGDFGPVRQIIWEPGWVHVGWHAPGRTGGAISLLKKVGSDFQVVT